MDEQHLIRKWWYPYLLLGTFLSGMGGVMLVAYILEV